MSASASASTAQRRAAPLSATVQIGLVAGLLAVAAGCWVLTGDRMDGMDAGPGTALGGLGWFLVSWAVMMAAMMLPATAPMAAAHARIRPAAWGRGTLAFVAGYLLAWTAAGLVAYALIEGVRSLDLGFLAWDEAGRYVAGGAILAAALFQLTPAKDACLRRCRDPQAARNGLEHGVALHRVLLGADGGALRAGRDEHRMDGLRRRAHRRRAPAAVAGSWPSRRSPSSWWCSGWPSRSRRARCPGSRSPTRRTRRGMTMTMQQ